jgi:ubiquinone/menaquinone biosynthesis C-methylase UbiE
MAQPNATVTEKTFSKFTQSQGANYAQYRKGYHPALYKTIILHHTTTGGQLGTLLDVGSGPGTVARELASEFQHVIGLDPSDGMMQQARLLGGTTGNGEAIRFEISSAEELGSHLTPKVEEGSVDLITAATAAHCKIIPSSLKASRFNAPWISCCLSLTSRFTTRR